MTKLMLPQELAEQFVGALLSILRSDGHVSASESLVLQRVVAEIIDGPVDYANALMLRVSPQTLAKAIHRATAASPYRSSAAVTHREVAIAFVDAARRLADAEGGLSVREDALIERYATALGLSADQ